MRPLTRLFALFTISTLGALAAHAEPPRVIADIAPVQSLAAAVTEGLSVPALLLPPGASPHDHSMRPSEAGALAEADLVFWVGPALSPWLQKSLESLGGEARIIALSEVEGATIWPARQGLERAPIAGTDDPHSWLDPENAVLWLGVIAQALSQADPEHAAQYATNAEAAAANIGAVVAEIRDQLAAADLKPYLVGHDAWQYFERRFDLPASWAIRDHEEQRPSPARLAALQGVVKTHAISCILAEPPVNEAEVATVFAGRAVKIVPLDPLGVTLERGPGLYPALLRATGQAIAACASE